MSSKKENYEEFDEQILALINKVKMDDDPEELKKFRKLFKKKVPLTMRTWVTASLMKEYLSRGNRGGRGKSPRTPRPVMAGGITLFVSIGKNRRVYPRDLIRLFISTGKIEREEIGEIVILDNYSFVTVKKESSDTIIGNLDGIDYRGRKLTVNFAKKKD